MNIKKRKRITFMTCYPTTEISKHSRNMSNKLYYDFICNAFLKEDYLLKIKRMIILLQKLNLSWLSRLEEFLH